MKTKSNDLGDKVRCLGSHECIQRNDQKMYVHKEKFSPEAKTKGGIVWETYWPVNGFRGEYLLNAWENGFC